MNKNFTEVIYIVDKSKNVVPSRNTIMSKFNSSVKAKVESGEQIKASVYTFNNYVNCIVKDVNITEVKPLTKKNFSPRGASTLNDTIGMVLDNVGQHIIKSAPADRPKKVEVIIFTAGKDDNSKNLYADQVRSLINYRRDYFGWDISFVNVSNTRLTAER